MQAPAAVGAPLGDLGEEAAVVPPPRLVDGPPHHGPGLGIHLQSGDVRRVGTRGLVPDVEGALRRQAPHRVLVAGDRLHDGSAPLGRRRARIRDGDREAGREALEIPFPRADRDLVEIVEVEDDVALRRTEQAEIVRVRVAVHHHVDAAARPARQVPGHDMGGPAQEREGRGRHPGDPQGDQMRLTALMRGLDQGDRVGPVRTGIQRGLARMGHLGAQPLAGLAALVPGLDAHAEVDPRKLRDRREHRVHTRGVGDAGFRGSPVALDAIHRCPIAACRAAAAVRVSPPSRERFPYGSIGPAL